MVRKTGTLGAGLVIAPQPAALPFVAALATGAGGALSFPTTAPTYRNTINLSRDCSYADNLNGFSAATIRLFYKPLGAINSVRTLLCAAFKRDSVTATHEAIVLTVLPDGSVQFKLNIADTMKTVTTSAGDIVSGSNYHLECTYDGMRIRVFVNGMMKGSAAASGAIQHPKEGAGAVSVMGC